MDEHRCSCGCKDEKELFDSSTMFFAVLCSCKTQSHKTKHLHNHQTQPYSLDNAIESENETTAPQTN
jgi:hypothetical protein